MSDKHRTTYGPAWLDTFADRMCNNGQELEAVAFRQMVASWQEDQNTIAELRLENSRLQQRLNRASEALGAPVSTYAFAGGTDRRAA